MKHLNAALLGLALILCVSPLFAQDQACGTVLTPEDVALQRAFNETWQQYAENRSGASIVMVPVQLHILRRSDGSLGISAADFEAALDRANEIFLPSSIQFYQCAPINTIDDDTYSPYDKTEMVALDAAHSVANVINIYSSESVTSGASSICGHAQFPGGLDFVMLANSCTNNGSTFAHELGHYFNLYHTHETALGTELVNGSNCTSAGDYLCDTPADPRLSTSTNVDVTSCVYTGTSTDTNGDSHNPETDNLMSYTGKHCRFAVSSGQNTRMLAAYNAYRTYLSCGSVVALDADFAADTEADCSNSLAVQFCDISEGTPTGWSWTFGDGATSTSQHPSHTYNAAGIYDVSLTITKAAASDVQTYTSKIKVGTVGIPYTQDFEAATALNPWKISSSMKNYLYMDAAAANGGSMGLLFDGYGTSAATFSPFFRTPASGATAFNELQNPYFKTKMELCVDASSYENLNLAFDLRQMYNFNSNYTNFRVLINGVQVGSVYQAAATELWTSPSIDLSAYDNTNFTLAFEASHKYSNAGGNATYLDNINLTGTQVLPVEYASFAVAQNGPDVILDWATLSEQNNERFEIMRSFDQTHWEAVAAVAAQSGKQGIKNYQFADRQAASLATDKIYYQLNQIDYNGSSYLSEIRSVKLSALSQMLVFPNPTQGQLNLILPQLEAGEVNIILHDIQGREIYQIERESMGNSVNQQYDLSLPALKSGVYLIRVKTHQQTFNRKIVVE
ncbi:MAG: PKD domain-containing protein [Bacteroidota bacterium]